MIVDDLRALDKEQRSAFLASLLGWTLDAFDFFLLTFIIKDIAGEFRVEPSKVLGAITLTLMARPFGAFFFGWLAERFGRRPVLMADVLIYAVLAFASAFSPNLIVLLVLRTAFGFAMGGEWGIGASLALETVPVKSRGVISGLLQEGYALGFLLASLANLLLPAIHWRGMLMLGVLPALLVLYIRRNVPESPAFEARRARTLAQGERTNLLRVLFVKRLPIVLYAVLLMTCFNFLSHGTQDVYPTFLKAQHRFAPWLVTTLAVCANVGAIVGGVTFGALSERIGRRRAIVLAALLALPIIPLWAFSTTPLLLGLGAFLIQVAVQGAWGVVPVHLNELSPEEARGAFPGTVYQLGNFIASGNAVIQGRIAEAHGNNYGLAMAWVAGIVAVLLALLTWFGPEAKGKRFG